MNKGFIIGLIFGGAAGAGTMYLVLKKRSDERIEEEIKKFKADQKKRCKKAPTASQGASEEPKEVLADRKNRTTTRSSLDVEQPKVEKKDYHKISENYMKPNPDVPPVNDPVETEHPEDDGPDFEIIAGNEVSGIDPDQVTYLIWDPEENVLQDEYGELVENREYLVGDILDTMLEESKNNGLTTPLESTIYIRNNKIDAIYEIETVADPDAGIIND
jgi:hypothetical protein